VPDSSIARLTDAAAPTLAGPEIGVASTKAFTCQLAVLAALAIGLGKARGIIDEAAESAVIGELVATPNMLSQVVLVPFLGLLAGPALAGGSCGPPIPTMQR
jgi:glutamine---fructose-6-phosphate transaminase (isomerizing)